MSTLHEQINKLDSLFLFILEIVAFTFSLIIAVFEDKRAAVFFIPLLILLIVPILIGYVKGAIIDNNFTERIIGWVLCIVGVTTYFIGASFPLFIDVFPSLLKPYEDIISLIQIGLMCILIYLVWILPQKVSIIYKILNQKYNSLTEYILFYSSILSITFGFIIYSIFNLLRYLYTELFLDFIIYGIVTLLLFVTFWGILKKLLRLILYENSETFDYVKLNIVLNKKIIISGMIAIYGISSYHIFKFLNVNILIRITSLVIFIIGSIISIKIMPHATFDIKDEIDIPLDMRNKILQILEDF